MYTLADMKRHPNKKNRIDKSAEQQKNSAVSNGQEASTETVHPEQETPQEVEFAIKDETDTNEIIDNLPDHIKEVLNEDKKRAVQEETVELRVADVVQNITIYTDAVDCRLIGKRVVVSKAGNSEVLVDCYAIHQKSLNEAEFKPVEFSFQDKGNHKISLTRLRLSQGAVEALILAYQKMVENKIIPRKLVIPKT